MNTSILHSIDESKYSNLLEEGFGISISLLLVDFEGRISETREQTSTKQLEAVTRIMENFRRIPPGETARIHWSGGEVFVASLEECGINAYLAMICEFSNVPAEKEYRQSIKACDITYTGLLDAVMLNCELNEMADDLTARYEELNLFYGLDDIVEGQDASKGYSALKKIASNCSRYLTTDIVSIVVEPANIDVCEFADCSEKLLDEWQTSSETVKRYLLENLVSFEQSLIINDVRQLARISGQLLAAKIAATAIHSVNGSLLGYLLLLRGAEGKDFSNSDWRLLRVVAEQVSTIASAGFDAVTGLLNRDGFIVPLSKAMLINNENADCRYLLVVDLDQFRIVNDSCGRNAGDELLRLVANQIKIVGSEHCNIARVEGDRFGVLTDACSLKYAQEIAFEIGKSIAESGFIWGGKTFDVTAGIGIVELNESIVDADEALAVGAIANDVAKIQGRGGVFIYDPNSDVVEKARSAVDWIPHIRHALENDSFELFAQQIVPLHAHSSNAVHYEILLRLRGPDGSTGSPFQMIKAAEAYNMVTRIDQWVIRSAMQALKKSRELYPDLDISYSVNMSAQSVTDEFFNYVKKLLLSSPELIPYCCLEITETAVVSNLASATRLINSLRGVGVKFAMDDFGSGMSSFGYLRDLPIDFLKIDGSFVKHIVDDPVSFAMVESIHRVGHIMGLRTVAEFVENDLIAKKLKDLGVDYGQGYALNKPAPLFEQLKQFANNRYDINNRQDDFGAERTQLNRGC